MRTLDDEELDSGDDDGRHDRRIMNDIDEEDVPLNIGDYVLSRVQIPESSDGEVCSSPVQTFYEFSQINVVLHPDDARLSQNRSRKLPPLHMLSPVFRCRRAVSLLASRSTNQGQAAGKFSYPSVV